MLAIWALACAVAALQLLGPESDSLEAQVLGASPTVTVYQYIEAALALVSTLGAFELACLAHSGHFFPRRRCAQA
jgi:hypothetical protein